MGFNQGITHSNNRFVLSILYGNIQKYSIFMKTRRIPDTRWHNVCFPTKKKKKKRQIRVNTFEMFLFGSRELWEEETRDQNLSYKVSAFPEIGLAEDIGQWEPWWTTGLSILTVQDFVTGSKTRSKKGIFAGHVTNYAAHIMSLDEFVCDACLWPTSFNEETKCDMCLSTSNW